jgi:hypothetical protein
MLRGLAGFGLWTRPWMHAAYPTRMPALGNVEADFFEPAAWKTEYPQPAFDRMDAADAFWAASLVARFTDRMLEAIVATGRLTDERAAAHLTDVLIRRRDKVVRHWITGTTPLDRFAVEAGGTTLAFDNAATRLGAAGATARYTARWFALDNATGTDTPVGAEVATSTTVLAVPADAWGPADGAGDRYAVVAIGAEHGAFPAWRTPERVTLRSRAGDVSVVGIERPR